MLKILTSKARVCAGTSCNQKPFLSSFSGRWYGRTSTRTHPHNITPEKSHIAALLPAGNTKELVAKLYFYPRAPVFLFWGNTQGLERDRYADSQIYIYIIIYIYKRLYRGIYGYRGIQGLGFISWAYCVVPF